MAENPICRHVDERLAPAMCNAFNHPPECSCGFGGDTGAGGLRQVDGYEWRLDRRPTLDTYIVPHARCPVCGDGVFFYQSPYGGRVFFDELGPPWPKHSCTDKRLANSSIFAPIIPSRRRVPHWLKTGQWHPLCEHASHSMKPRNRYNDK
jgi:hypothetical protein